MSNYYRHPYCSNSKLTALKMELETPEVQREYSLQFSFGTLVDAMITEPKKVDWIKFTCTDGMGELLHYSAEEFKKARCMRDSYLSDPYIKMTRGKVEGQAEFYADEVPFNHNGVDFVLPFRCKFDEWMPAVGFGHEIKTTAAKTQKDFEASIMQFDYDRAAFLYLTITGSDKFALYGISKKSPHQLFKFFITRQSQWFESGRQKATGLAFKYYMLKYAEL